MNIRIPIKASPVAGPSNRITITAETRMITADQPKGLKDAWKVLRGTYEVRLRQSVPPDLNTVLKEVWNKPALDEIQSAWPQSPTRPSRGGISRRWSR